MHFYWHGIGRNHVRYTFWFAYENMRANLKGIVVLAWGPTVSDLSYTLTLGFDPFAVW